MHRHLLQKKTNRTANKKKVYAKTDLRKNHNHKLPYPNQPVHKRRQNPKPVSQNPHRQQYCLERRHGCTESHLLNTPVGDPDFALDPVDVLVEGVEKLRLPLHLFADLDAHLLLAPYDGGELVDGLVLGLHLLFL